MKKVLTIALCSVLALWVIVGAGCFGTPNIPQNHADASATLAKANYAVDTIAKEDYNLAEVSTFLEDNGLGSVLEKFPNLEEDLKSFEDKAETIVFATNESTANAMGIMYFEDEATATEFYNTIKGALDEITKLGLDSQINIGSLLLAHGVQGTAVYMGTRMALSTFSSSSIPSVN